MAAAAAPVLIAVASWDSPSVVVFSLPPSAGNAAHPQEIADSIQRTANPSAEVTDAVETLATWRPPWGDSAEAAAAAVAGTREGGAKFLTRALAFVNSGKGPEGTSLVAATGVGAVAVASWQESKAGGRTGGKSKGKNVLRGSFVSVALFQIGRGPARLEVFQSQDFMETAQERVFVNDSYMDAVIYRCSNADKAAMPDECRGGWSWVQVSSALRATK